MLSYIGLIKLFLLLNGVILLLSLPGLDRVTEVKENGFSEGVNKASIDQNIIFYYKKVTQEVLTSQKSNSTELITDTITNAILRESHCSGCGDSDDIEIIKGHEYISAIVPSKRGDSSEAIVISVSFPWGRDGGNELGSVAGLLIPLSRHFGKIHWSSKDIILLFTDSNIPNSMGISSFIKDLSTNQSLIKHNGRIRTALCVEVLSLSPKKILIDIESMDGLQTNQDFPNAIIREVESYFAYPPVYIGTRTFWDSITRQAFNGGSSKPHSRFLQNNINSFTLSFVDEIAVDSSGSNSPSRNSYEKNEFISIFPIQYFEIYKILEGTTKIQSNLHDELHQSIGSYYYTSYYSVLSFGFYLIPLLLMLVPSVLEVLVQITANNCLVLVGIIITAFLISSSSSILLLIRHLLENIDYLPSGCLHSTTEDVYLRYWLTILFLLLLSTAMVTYSIKKIIKLLMVRKDSNAYRNIKNSMKALNNIFILVLSIFLSTKNFGISVFITPIILLINLIMDSSIIKKCLIMVFIILTMDLYFNSWLGGWTCLIIPILFKKTSYFLISIANFLYSKNFTNNIGFNISSARNFASVWDSAMGNEIFCGNEGMLPIGIISQCNKHLDNFAQMTKQYQIIKIFPILQWIRWAEIKFDNSICNYKR
ncbi:hypothetical protein OJ252_2856 [Cryptosporidium canis]|uniref:Uncharacterized protein n=1 Tax=Cryptosporidium canis TaxID=195482 RepID=A0ABQ8P523_9CRYT|nr:hypothetical protein OJ252_2856 [Cryptosporidium canis]